MPTSHLNAAITFDGIRYEIYWTTTAALHVLENYLKDQNGGVHKGLDHRWVAHILRKAIYILPLNKPKEPYLHVLLTRLRGTVYESYAYLVPELDQRPPRCVVVTCYKSNKQQYRELFDPSESS